MAIREILSDSEYHEALIKGSRAVDKFDSRLHRLLDDMAETMREADGAGLAAPQVGILRRAVVIEHEGEIIELINPEIVYESSELEEDLEGCLSLPGMYAVVERPRVVKVLAFDRNGAKFELEGEGVLARAICHETDHLDGKLFSRLVDRMLTTDEIEEYLKKRGGEKDTDPLGVSEDE